MTLIEKEIVWLLFNVSVINGTLIVTNTCGFDSLCQILSTSLVNNEAYNNALLETSSKLISCVKVFKKEGLNAHFYRERAKILCNLNQLKPDIRQNSIIKVSAISNIANLTTCSKMFQVLLKRIHVTHAIV